MSDMDVQGDVDDLLEAPYGNESAKVGNENIDTKRTSVKKSQVCCKRIGDRITVS